MVYSKTLTTLLENIQLKQISKQINIDKITNQKLIKNEKHYYNKNITTFKSSGPFKSYSKDMPHYKRKN